MVLTLKDQRLYRRYNPISRRLMSIFMVIIVFPALTGLDGVAYDDINAINAKRAQEQYTHDQLCEIAPKYLQGNLIPRLRALAQTVKASNGQRSTDSENALKSQVTDLTNDLKRLKLALLDTLSKNKSRTEANVPVSDPNVGADVPRQRSAEPQRSPTPRNR